MNYVLATEKNCDESLKNKQWNFKRSKKFTGHYHYRESTH